MHVVLGVLPGVVLTADRGVGATMAALRHRVSGGERRHV
jgi:hypothetical protein